MQEVTFYCLEHEESFGAGTLFILCVCVFPDEQVFQASPFTSAGAEARRLLHSEEALSPHHLPCQAPQCPAEVHLP